MRVIVHISDMHFGKIDTSCINPMLRAINSVKPDLVIVSGDSTQRARVKEFEGIEKFLRNLEHPHLIIPGNHDIRPLYNPIARIADPYDLYKKYVCETLEPAFVDDEIAVASVNTVRTSAIKDGRVNKRQILSLAKWFNRYDGNRIKIVVTHHPFDMPPDWSKQKLARRAEMAVHALADADIDLYLSGHYHHSSIAHTAERYDIENYSAVASQAGTVSVRQRKEVQSFNLIIIDHPTIRIDTYLYNSKKKMFNLYSTKTFKKTGKSWKVISA